MRKVFEKRVCDICESEEARNICSICGKDVCHSHSYRYTLYKTKGYSTSMGWCFVMGGKEVKEITICDECDKVEPKHIIITIGEK